MDVVGELVMGGGWRVLGGGWECFNSYQLFDATSDELSTQEQPISVQSAPLATRPMARAERDESNPKRTTKMLPTCTQDAQCDPLTTKGYTQHSNNTSRTNPNTQEFVRTTSKSLKNAQTCNVPSINEDNNEFVWMQLSVRRAVEAGARHNRDHTRTAVDAAVPVGGCVEMVQAASQDRTNEQTAEQNINMPVSQCVQQRVVTDTVVAQIVDIRTQCKSMQCTSAAVRNGKAAVAAHSLARARSRMAARAMKKTKNQLASLKVNAGTARRRDTRRRSARAASQPVSTRSQPQAPRSLPRIRAVHQVRFVPMASTIPMQQIVPVYFPSPVGSQASQQTETWYVRTSPADSHARRVGRRRIRSVAFWIWLDILPNQLR